MPLVPAEGEEISVRRRLELRAEQFPYRTNVESLKSRLKFDQEQHQLNRHEIIKKRKMHAKMQVQHALDVSAQAKTGDIARRIALLRQIEERLLAAEVNRLNRVNMVRTDAQVHVDTVNARVAKTQAMMQLKTLIFNQSINEKLQQAAVRHQKHLEDLASVASVDVDRARKNVQEFRMKRDLDTRYHGLLHEMKQDTSELRREMIQTVKVEKSKISNNAGQLAAQIHRRDDAVKAINHAEELSMKQIRAKQLHDFTLGQKWVRAHEHNQKVKALERKLQEDRAELAAHRRMELNTRLRRAAMRREHILQQRKVVAKRMAALGVKKPGLRRVQSHEIKMKTQ